MVKVKVKLTLEQATKAQRWSSITLFFLQPRRMMGVGGQRHAPAALPRERPGTHCKGGWVGPQGRSGQVQKISPPTGIRTPERPARSESPYGLSYSGLMDSYIYMYKIESRTTFRVTVIATKTHIFTTWKTWDIWRPEPNFSEYGTDLFKPHNTGTNGIPTPEAYPGILFGGGGVQQIQLRTERTGIWGR